MSQYILVKSPKTSEWAVRHSATQQTVGWYRTKRAALAVQARLNGTPAPVASRAACEIIWEKAS